MDSRRQGAPGALRLRRPRPLHGVGARRFAVFRMRRADRRDVVPGCAGVGRERSLLRQARRLAARMALSGTFFPVAQAARSEGRRAGFVPAVPEDGQLQVDDVRSGAARSGSSGAALDLGGRGQARGLGRGLERAGFRVLATAIPRAFSGLRRRGFRAGAPRSDFSLAREARTLPVLPDHEGGVYGALSTRLLAGGGEVPAPHLERGWGRSERGASCESRNDLVGFVSAAEADALAQRPAGVLYLQRGRSCGQPGGGDLLRQHAEGRRFRRLSAFAG